MAQNIEMFLKYLEVTKALVISEYNAVRKFLNSITDGQSIYTEAYRKFVRPILSPLFSGYKKDTTNAVAGRYLLAGGIASWEKYRYVYAVTDYEHDVRNFQAPDYTKIPVQGMAVVASISEFPDELSEIACLMETQAIAAFINVKMIGNMQEIHLDLLLPIISDNELCFGILPYVVTVPIGGLVTRGKLKMAIPVDISRVAEVTKTLALMLLHSAGSLVKSEEFEDVPYSGKYSHHPTPDFSNVIPSSEIRIITRRTTATTHNGGGAGGHHESPAPHIRTGHYRRVRVGSRNNWHYETRWIKETTVGFRGEVPFTTASVTKKNKEE